MLNRNVKPVLAPAWATAVLALIQHEQRERKRLGLEENADLDAAWLAIFDASVRARQT